MTTQPKACAVTASGYRTLPDPAETGWPKGVPYIIGNEGCERFSFYGMKAVLKVYLATLYVAQGMEEQLATNHSSAVVHLFITGVYAMPMIGAIVADRLLGKYHTIIWLSLVYCLGHASLALFEGYLPGIYLGLFLIAIGSGGIKPCVSANVGDQFGPGNWHRLAGVFQAFYFIINFGSFFATLLIPLVKETPWLGWSWAFGIPGILMGLATLVFWIGRKVFVHVQPEPGGRLGMLDTLASVLLFMTVGSFFFTAPMAWYGMLAISVGCLIAGLGVFQVRQRIAPDDGFLAVLIYTAKTRLLGHAEEKPLVAAVAEAEKGEHSQAFGDLRQHSLFGPAARRFGQQAAEGPIAVLRIVSVFFLVSVFWALFDQHSTSWIDQAGMMDRHFDLPLFGQFEVLKEQTPAVNPILVMLLIPLVSFAIYPAIEKLGLRMTPLRRMTGGMLIASLAFVTVALIQRRIDAGETVHVSEQVLPYVLMTLAEVMVSVTGLEFAYSQAPRRMKSTIMGFWLLTVSLGNVIAAVFFSSMDDWGLLEFFWLFAALMAVAGVLFGVRAAFYRYQDYQQAA